MKCYINFVQTSIQVALDLGSNLIFLLLRQGIIRDHAAVRLEGRKEKKQKQIKQYVGWNFFKVI